VIGKAGHLYTASTSATNMVDGDGNIVTTPRHFRPSNLYLPIECAPGVQDHFPDPYDCSVYHYCNGMLSNKLTLIISCFIGGVDKPLFCDAGLFYDKSEFSLA
jgi:hypothetical protein